MITAIGWLLHNTYEWSNCNNVVALFAPVNESVWEHLKLGYGGVILFTLIEYPTLKNRVNNYIAAKAISIGAISMTILIIYYTYRYFIDHSILWLDISSFILGVAFGQTISYYLFLLPHIKTLNFISKIVMLIFFLIFSWCTYYPPAWPIFKDNHFNSYGIPSRQHQ